MFHHLCNPTHVIGEHPSGKELEFLRGTEQPSWYSKNITVWLQLSEGKQSASWCLSSSPVGSVHCMVGGDFVTPAASLVRKWWQSKLSCNDHYLITNQRNHYLYICRKHMFYFSFDLMSTLSRIIIHERRDFYWYFIFIVQGQIFCNRISQPPILRCTDSSKNRSKIT